MNIAETVKRQTDRILRQRALNGTDRIEVSGIASGTGAPAPTVNSPAADLTTHRATGDHDSRYYTENELDAGQLDTRYYTEAEVDALIATAGANWEPLTDGNSNFIFYNGDVVMGKVM